MTPMEMLHRKVERRAADMVRAQDLESALEGATDAGHPCVVTQEDVAVARSLMMAIARHPGVNGTALGVAAQEACSALIGYVEPPKEARV